MRKQILCILLTVCMLLSLAACTGKSEALSSGPLTCEHETKFGGAYLHMTIEDFVKLGFEYGDSVDIAFDNGFKLENIPFYNGYYTNAGEALLCAYPGYPYIKACISYGDDLWETGSLKDGCTAVVTLREKGTFRSAQNVMSMVYSNEREHFASDEVFANFRPMSGGELAEGLFFRAASPCDNQYSRAPFSSALSQKAGIAYILDLADDAEELAAYYSDAQLDCPYWKELYENGCVLPLDMAANYKTPEYAAKVADAMRAVTANSGPFLIHCTEGKDRTGFVCLLVEALAGASLDELRDDYMLTYDNYYGVTEESDSDGYDAVVHIKFNDMVLYLCGAEDISEITSEALTKGAEQYLAFGGMDSAEIAALRSTITK